MHYGKPGSSFATQDYEASEGAMAAPWSGGVNVGARRHDCLGMKVRGLVV